MLGRVASPSPFNEPGHSRIQLHAGAVGLPFAGIPDFLIDLNHPVDEITNLQEGLTILEPLLAAHGFAPGPIRSGAGSGGLFASGE